MSIRFTYRKSFSVNKNIAVPTQSKWITRIAWVAASIMILLMVSAIYQYVYGNSIIELFRVDTLIGTNNQSSANLPELTTGNNFQSVQRAANLDTVLPAGSRKNVVFYTVKKGDAIFGIAKIFEIKPESLLWANYDILKDDPHLISVGIKLRIPPTDGILYKWKEGDTLDKIAGKYHVDVKDILLYPGNNLDMTNPVIEPETLVMIPGGYREFNQTWVVPVVASGHAGVTVKINGPGACVPTATGPAGTYSFVWPTPHRSISGNDYWSGHQAIDITAYMGDPIYASDSGVVIYSGWINGGYGNMIAIDHLNGYVTLYAHLSAVNVGCGQGVNRGQVIGYAGSTGNSTGPHLHFEVRLNGGFVNPWHVLQ